MLFHWTPSTCRLKKAVGCVQCKKWLVETMVVWVEVERAISEIGIYRQRSPSCCGHYYSDPSSDPGDVVEHWTTSTQIPANHCNLFGGIVGAGFDLITSMLHFGRRALHSSSWLFLGRSTQSVYTCMGHGCKGKQCKSKQLGTTCPYPRLKSWGFPSDLWLPEMRFDCPHWGPWRSRSNGIIR